jgi:hypothetical protein
VSLDLKVDGVCDSKDIFRVKSVLDGFQEALVRLANSVLCEGLSNLSDSMMMRDAASLLDDLIPSCKLNLVIDLERILDPHIVEAEINIDRSSDFIKLGHTETDKYFIAHSMLMAQVHDSLSHVVAQRDHLLPRAGSLERLSYEVEILADVSEISDNESQLVASEPVGSACLKPMELLCCRVDEFPLCVDCFLVSFKENSSCDHLRRVKALKLGHVELFNGVNGVLSSRSLCFEGLAELELDVVYETEGGGPDAAVAYFLHEFASGLVVWEDVRPMG